MRPVPCAPATCRCVVTANAPMLGQNRTAYSTSAPK